jgi:pimeloyl-ACP methyl ester carboxylesterase
LPDIQPLTLPFAVTGERHEIKGAAGLLSYYAAGPAVAGPLLLIHSINAAGSAYEVRPLYERYSVNRSVYALELPGFGFSERSDRDYTPRLMTDAVHAMVKETRRIHGDAPFDALAISLSAEFLARAASEDPKAFRSIGLISPTAIRPNGLLRAVRAPDRGSANFCRFAAVPFSACSLAGPAYGIFCAKPGDRRRSMRGCWNTII